MLQPSSFKNPDVRTAANKAAMPMRMVQSPKQKLFGEGTLDDCATTVNAPVLVGEFAFLTYSEPGGEIGAFAFQRQGSTWQVREQVRLGYW